MLSGFVTFGSYGKTVGSILEGSATGLSWFCDGELVLVGVEEDAVGLGLMGLLISGLAGSLVESAFLSAATLGSSSCFLVYSSGFTIGSGISSFGFVAEGLAGVYGFINVVFYVLSDLSASIGVIYGPVDFAVISFSLDSFVLLVGLAKS